MKTYLSEDLLTSKHIHTDLSETCIKTVPSLIAHPTKEDLVEEVDRNKYSLFVSHSSGCPFKCKFCYLAIDEVPFVKTPRIRRLGNIWEALEHRVEHDPSLRDRYIKLCWMGMGEPILQPEVLYEETMTLLDEIMIHRLAKGVDGVDISTILPNIKSDDWVHTLSLLNKSLSEYPLNPHNKQAENVGEGSTFVRYKERSIFRLFYSLHSAIQSTRDEIIPNAMCLDYAIEDLQYVAGEGIDVIFHHMFLEGINDSEEEVEAIINFMYNFPKSELRILRYNKHEDSDLRESDTFKECMCMLGGRVPKIKVQISQGADVKSACGQFVYNKEHRIQEYQVVEGAIK